MPHTTASDIKLARRESLLFKEISRLFLELTKEEKQLQGIFINRVKLSRDKGICNVLFYTPEGEAAFKEKLEILKLYKPSLRQALAQEIKGRYVPDLMFRFDEQFEKQQRVERALEKIKTGD